MWRCRDKRIALAFAVLAATGLGAGAGTDAVAATAPSPPCASTSVEARSPTHRPRIANHLLRRGDKLAPDAHVAVPPHGWLRLARRGSRYRFGPSHLTVSCDAVVLEVGTARLEAPRYRPGRAALVTPQAHLRADRAGTVVLVTVGVRTRARIVSGVVVATSPTVPGPPLDAGPTDVVVVDKRSVPRLDTWPFGRSAEEHRATAADHLPAFWADGLACSTGCRAPGAVAGWPLRPFHRQHPLRAGLNELRDSSMHHGVDIQAADGSQVYAIEPGTAHVIVAAGPEERVQVGRFIYWHIHHAVIEGETVRPYSTLLGRVQNGFGHLHLSEVIGDTYLNPLRPGGRALQPWRDVDPPVIGAPVLRGGGTATVQVFDPQSFRRKIKYRTPVLAPAALAYRARDAAGRDISGLRFALRGSQNLPFSLASSIFVPDSFKPGFTCFDRRPACVPRWDYRLAGGLAPALPAATRTLSVYAWDWAGNVDVRTVRLS